MLRIKIIIPLLLFFSTISFSQNADDIVGKYHLPNNLDVEIFKFKTKYFGKIIALNGYNKGQTKDIKNPNKEKRDNLLLGKIIIINLEFNEENKQWKNGKIYAPEKGMFVNLNITDINNNEIEIVASKYLFRKTLTWEKF